MKKFFLTFYLLFFPFLFLDVLKANEYEFLTGSVSGNTVTFSGSNSNGTSTVLKTAPVCMCNHRDGEPPLTAKRPS